MSGRKKLSLLVCFVTLACQSDAPQDVGPSQTGLPEYRLAPKPRAAVGSTEDDVLERVVAAVLVGSRLAIADAGAHRVVVTDSLGTMVSSHGREGFGPEEYRSLQGVFRHADGLATWDTGHSRLVFLDSLAEYRRGLSIDQRLGRLNEFVGTFGGLGLFSARELGLFGYGAMGPQEVRRPVQFVFVRLDDGAPVLETERPGREEWVVRTEDGRSAALPIPLGHTAWAAATGAGFVVGTTDSAHVTLVDEAGERSLPLPLDPPTDTEGWWTEARQQLQDRIRTADYREASKNFDLELLESIPERHSPPTFSGLRGGRDGHLWVKLSSAPEDAASRWLVMDREGSPIRTVLIPAAVEVLDVALESVVVLRVGRFDEHVVQWYRLEEAR